MFEGKIVNIVLPINIVLHIFIALNIVLHMFWLRNKKNIFFYVITNIILCAWGVI